MDGLMKLEIPGGKLCLLRLDAVDDAQLARWETWLDPEKRARIGRQDAQHRRPGATAPQALRCARSASGRPSCPVLPLSFSLSHSGGYAACAVSARPVGVDLEEIRPLRPALLGILNEEERAWMGDDAARFAQLWTAKEAMLKCRGAALGRLRQLPLAMTPDGPAAQQGALRLFFPPAPGGYALALCMEE